MKDYKEFAVRLTQVGYPADWALLSDRWTLRKTCSKILIRGIRSMG